MATRKKQAEPPREGIPAVIAGGCMKGGSYSPSYWEAHTSMAVEPKMDGYRLHAVFDAQGRARFASQLLVEPYTTNLRHVLDQLELTGLHDAMLDGEIMLTGWNDTALARKPNLTDEDRQALKEKAVFHVFDCVDLSKVREQAVGRVQRHVFDMPLHERREVLEDLTDWSSAHIHLPNVRLVAQSIVKSHEGFERTCAAHIEAGHEGGMGKDLHSPYVFARTKHWHKHKPVRTFDAVITGYEEGTGKYVGVLGALHVRDSAGMECKVGGGFTDAVRAWFWSHRDAALGCVVEVKVQDDKVAKARHPIYLRLREDKLAEDLGEPIDDF